MRPYWEEGGRQSPACSEMVRGADPKPSPRPQRNSFLLNIFIKHSNYNIYY